MREKLMKNYLKGQLIISNKIRSFMSEERGASDIVAIIVLIVIIIAVATVFQGRLSDSIGNIFNSLDSFIDK